MPRITNKREMLVFSANKLFLEKGTDLTTLADIAQAADVPLGNIYYYFKTKKELVLAIIKLRYTELELLLTNIEERHAEPIAQIKAFMEMFLNVNQPEEQTIGAMITSFWQDITKSKDVMLDDFLPLPNLVLQWLVKRFEALGKSNPKEHAIGLLSSMQGLLLMNSSPVAKEQLPIQAKFIECSFGLSL